ncbi:MAG: acyl-CoA dehydrogenase family protein [Sphingomonadales bacterium]|nr:acyl-CoA dehydrogenase family protein [Sphingomonadales bacterium]
MGGESVSTAAIMLEKFETIRPLLAKECVNFDSQRRLSDDAFLALSEAGFFRLLLPTELGGCGLSALDFMTVVEHAAALDGTIGWLVGNGGGMSRVGGYLPLGAAQAVFGKPSAFVASSTAAIGKAVPVEGGYRITGRWFFASGAPHATTFAPLCEVDDDSGRIVLAFLPREAVKLIDNWHVSGMRGTGSWDFEATDAFLPMEYVCDFQPDPTHAGIVYRLPGVSAFVWTVATVPLGIAKGAIDAFVAASSGHRRQGMTIPVAERELAQSEIGHCVAQYRAAGAYMRSSMTTLCAAVESKDADLVAARIDYRLACSHAAEVAVGIVLRVNDLIGARALAESQPFERRERDVRAAAKHVAMSAEQFVIGGRYALGGDISSASF